MTDHLRMKGKNALTIEEAEALIYGVDSFRSDRYNKAIRKIQKGVVEAISRRDTREHMRKQGAAAAKKAGYTPEQLREEAKKAGVKIVKEEGD